MRRGWLLGRGTVVGEGNGCWVGGCVKEESGRGGVGGGEDAMKGGIVGLLGGEDRRRGGDVYSKMQREDNRRGGDIL